MEPIVPEGDTLFNTKLIPNLDQPYSLRKNDNLLVVDVDYTIGGLGEIELKDGIVRGDNLVISYIAKRFVGPETIIKTVYSYFDYLKKGSNVKISFMAKNPDNFYIGIQHGTNLMDSYQKELISKNNLISNSSSSGFPTGEIPTQDNTTSGNDSHVYRLGIIDEKIDLALRWWNFFDTRLAYFETERVILNGYLVGAEDGRVTISDIENSVNPPPTRLFPVPDTRPDDQKFEPLRVPALDGLNQNDAGSSSQGTQVPSIITTLSDETSKINSEISKLNTLLGMSTTASSITSTGSFNIPLMGEQMVLYVEVKSGSLITQNTVYANFLSGDPTATYIAGRINQGCAYAGIPFIATVSGSNVVMSANNTSVLCIYVVGDAPNVGFGTGSCAAVRSRHTLWTGGYSSSYSRTIPGSNSVHLDIVSENSTRSTDISLHNSQVTQLLGQVDEWIPPFNVSFPYSKAEIENVPPWVLSTNTATTDSNIFDDRKDMSQHPFDSIDSNLVITNRITYLNTRKNSGITPRQTRITARLAEIQNSLTSESLYDQRYLWLTILANKSSGLYADQKFEIDNEARKQKEALRNNGAINSIGMFS